MEDMDQFVRVRRTGGLREKGQDTYPRMVRMILINRSGPQSAMRKTPTGGTGWCATRSARDFFHNERVRKGEAYSGS